MDSVKVDCAKGSSEIRLFHLSLLHKAQHIYSTWTLSYSCTSKIKSQSHLDNKKAYYVSWQYYRLN